MPHEHHHAVAAEPTLSLLRLSAGQRLLAVAMLLAGLWGLVITVVS